MTDVGTEMLIDLHPPGETMERDVLKGLRKSPKQLPPRLLYDKRGSELFDAICELEDYYPTRTELRIMSDNIVEIAATLGPRCALIEYGAGSGQKTKYLLENLSDPAACVVIDVSKTPVLNVTEELHAMFPRLEVIPIRADFNQKIELPEFKSEVGRRVAYFPGSTIGNFSREEARKFLRRVRCACGDNGGMLIGIDLKKDRATLERAYNDSEGVTAQFNLNLLRRFNRNLDANFDADKFQHLAVYNEREGRVEMHLLSLSKQTVSVAGVDIEFDQGETIHTESSHKFSLKDCEKLANCCGFTVERVWQDDDHLFSVQFWAAS